MMDSCNFGKICSIMAHIGDQYSQMMYGYRLLYSLSESAEGAVQSDQIPSYIWIRKLVEMTDDGKVFLRKLEKSENREKVIFGAGFWGRTLLKNYPDIRWSCFVGQGIREGAGRKISPDVPAAAWVSGAFRTGAFVGIFWREGRNLQLFRWAGIS